MSLLFAISALLSQITETPIFEAFVSHWRQENVKSFWLDCTQVGDNLYDCDGGQL